MTDQEAIAKLKEAQANTDIEAAHSDADDVLCALLVTWGYGHIVKEWKAVPKWYA